jgi:8-oxo-dGTP diphosphatase
MGIDSLPNKLRLTVAVGVLINTDGSVLIAQRPAGKHMAGAWEFPGGKVDPGETVVDALSRELFEELEVRVVSAEALLEHEHEYPDRIVNLCVYLVTEFADSGLSAIGSEGQALRWVLPENLMKSGLLPADQPIANVLSARFSAER